MGWLYLGLAIGLEIIATSMLKLSAGMTRLVPSLLVFPLYGLSFTGLAFALKSVELGTAYAIWSAVGTAVIAVIGVFYFGEALSPLKLVSLALVIAGVIGLNLSASS